MKVLIACEESQRVTKSFRSNGHEAFSCDILESSGGHPEWHLQGDVREFLYDEWDMIIAFPPCTHLAVSGAKHFKKKRESGVQQEAIKFFMLFTDLNCPRVAIENPVGIMSTEYRKPDQIIQPYEHGDPSRKATCLWLKGLPLITPSNVVEPILMTTSTGKTFSKDYSSTPEQYKGIPRKIYRSKTYPGIARALADQWSDPVIMNEQFNMELNIKKEK